VDEAVARRRWGTIIRCNAVHNFCAHYRAVDTVVGLGAEVPQLECEDISRFDDHAFVNVIIFSTCHSTRHGAKSECTQQTKYVE